MSKMLNENVSGTIPLKIHTAFNNWFLLSNSSWEQALEKKGNTYVAGPMWKHQPSHHHHRQHKARVGAGVRAPRPTSIFFTNSFRLTLRRLCLGLSHCPSWDSITGRYSKGGHIYVLLNVQMTKMYLMTKMTKTAIYREEMGLGEMKGAMFKYSHTGLELQSINFEGTQQFSPWHTSLL